MSRNIYLMLALIVCVFLPMRAQAGDVADPNRERTQVPTIELTKLVVNDTNLELSYKIKNNTDHKVWICGDVSVRTTFDFELSLAEDEQSLLIRRRLDVPTAWEWTISPVGRYVLLRSGQERNESLLFGVPVKPSVCSQANWRPQTTQGVLFSRLAFTTKTCLR